jgi:hypothetical protein
MSVASKLQLKAGMTVAVLHPPDGVDLGIGNFTADPPDAGAVILFVDDKAALDADAGPFLAAARRDALAWIVYPKAGQRGTDLNRDTLVAHLDGKGIRPVRQVAIDPVWSALRFRPA